METRKNVTINSAVFYASFMEAGELLPDADRLSFYDAVFSYAFTGTVCEMTKIANALFITVKPQMDANRARYENGCKGGRPKNQKESGEEPNDNQTETEKEPKQNQDKTKTKPNSNLSRTKGKPNYDYDEDYDLDEEEKNAHAREVLSSLQAIGCEVDCEIPEDLDISALIEKIRQSEYLREWRFLSKYLAKADKILAGYYDKYKQTDYHNKLPPMLTREKATDEMPPIFDADAKV